MQTFEWKWADFPQVGMPQDFYSLKGPVYFEFSMGLAGDWANFFNAADWAGKFDEKTREYDLQIDYVRTYKLAEQEK